MGSITVATLTPEKTINLPGACRDVPSNELFFKELSKQLWLNCPTGCRPDILGARIALLFGSYPICDVNMGSMCRSAADMQQKYHLAFSEDIFELDIMMFHSKSAVDLLKLLSLKRSFCF